MTSERPASGNCRPRDQAWARTNPSTTPASSLARKSADAASGGHRPDDAATCSAAGPGCKPGDTQGKRCPGRVRASASPWVSGIQPSDQEHGEQYLQHAEVVSVDRDPVKLGEPVDRGHARSRRGRRRRVRAGDRVRARSRRARRPLPALSGHLPASRPAAPSSRPGRRCSLAGLNSNLAHWEKNDERVVEDDLADQVVLVPPPPHLEDELGDGQRIAVPQSPAELTMIRSAPYISIMSAARAGVHLVIG